MTQSHRFARSLVVTIALAVSLTAGGAWAARPVIPAVTGQVTSQPESTVIEVNGTRYLVAVNSPAAAQLASLHVGDSIGLVLDGPATSSASHVVAIIASPSGAASGGVSPK